MKEAELPQVGQLERELTRTRIHSRFWAVLKNTLGMLLIAAAAAALVAMFWLPTMRIYGSSMAPTLTQGDTVIAVKGAKVRPGDIVAFYYSGKLLIKRCIAVENQWITIEETGDVYVEGQRLEEPYLAEKALGECDISFPFQVPEGMLFVMGDCRTSSVDSRSRAVGCVARGEIVGKIFLRIWPLEKFEWMGK